jgi:NAD-reducing hydrogenase small subunit
MAKHTLATCSLTGCFGCHMSLLDIDDRMLELVQLVDFDKSPFDDKKCFDSIVDIGFVEGGVSDDHNVETLRAFREHCKILIGVGACAINGGVPALRNTVSLHDCLATTYLKDGVEDADHMIPRDEDLPRLLDRVYPVHEIVKIDYFLPGCPPSADAIWAGLTALIAGRVPDLPYLLLKYD